LIMETPVLRVCAGCQRVEGLTNLDSLRDAPKIGI